MAMRKNQNGSNGVVGIFRDACNAGQAVDILAQRGFAASPISGDQAKTYRSNVRSDDILVYVECGDACDFAQSTLSDCGASQVDSSGAPRRRGTAAGGTGAGSILTSHDTERVVDIDGELEVKEGPYVEPDMIDIGDILCL